MFELDILLTAEGWIALLTLTFLEVVLGIDNIIFISIVANKLPEEEEKKARNIGLILALVTRILLLLGISWIIGFTDTLFEIYTHEVSGRDLILAAGGLFLIAKSTLEIHDKVLHEEGAEDLKSSKPKSFSLTILQIVTLDVVFSFDSILTAIGLTEEILLMVIAVVVSIIIMIIYAGRVSAFIAKYPTLQILALSFLILIGFMLFLESLHLHVPKGYIYFAVLFSLIVEVVNIRMRKNIKSRKNG